MILRRARAYLTPVMVILLFLLPLAFPGWILFLITVALAKALAALGVAQLLRGGLVSFGHAMFFAAGAYACGFLMKYLGVREAFVVVPAGIMAGLTLAALLGLFITRYREVFFALLNLGFSMVIYALLLKFYLITGGTDGIPIKIPTFGGFEISPYLFRQFYYIFVAALFGVAVMFLYRFVNSPLGYTFRASRDNEVRVEYLGVSVARGIYITYIISGALAGLGGTLTAIAVGHIVPELSYWTISGEFVFIALLGGFWDIPGPLVGAIFFEFLRSYAYKFVPYLWQLILGLGMLIIVFFLPGGLWSVAPIIKRRVTQWMWFSKQ